MEIDGEGMESCLKLAIEGGQKEMTTIGGRQEAQRQRANTKIYGESMKSCIMLAIEDQQKKITTIEGLQQAPIQEQFVENFAFQCGYCSPGFIMNCHALVNQLPNASDSDMKEWLESNMCRC